MSPPTTLRALHFEIGLIADGTAQQQKARVQAILHDLRTFRAKQQKDITALLERNPSYGRVQTMDGRLPRICKGTRRTTTQPSSRGTIRGVLQGPQWTVSGL